jgi:ATP-dependent exoDNAse (exonuclease V) alpha subunit
MQVSDKMTASDGPVKRGGDPILALPQNAAQPLGREFGERVVNADFGGVDVIQFRVNGADSVFEFV